MNAIDDPQLEIVARAILRSRGATIVASDKEWPPTFAHYREMAAKHGPLYTSGRSLVTDAIRDAGAALEAIGWRCFHCGEVFTDVAAARLHFGVDQDYEPGCVARVPDEERELLRKIQEQEAELDGYRQEDSAKDRQMAAMRSDHATALLREEEKGYERGIRDVRAEGRWKGLARHALGLPNSRKRTHRNHFCAGPEHDDFDDWQAMVGAGYAKKRTSSVLAPGDVFFHLTRSGAELALLPGERLDPEDWPAVPA